MKSRFTELKEAVGTSLMPLVSLVLQAANAIVSFCVKVAKALQPVIEYVTTAFTQLLALFGIQVDFFKSGDPAPGAGQLAEDMSSISDNADTATDSIKDMEKEVNRLQGFDEINLLPQDDKSSDTGISTPAFNNSELDMNVDSGPIDEAGNKLNKFKDIIDGVIIKAKSLFGLFKEGFKIGFGNSVEVFECIKNHLKSIKNSFIDIFTDNGVVNSFNDMLDSIALNLGKLAGSAASIGLSVADCLTGSIAGFLEDNVDFIKERIISMFDVTDEIFDIVGNFAVAFADFFTIFRSPEAKQIGADLLSIFIDPLLTIIDTVGKLARDILNIIAQPFIENIDKLKEWGNNVLEIVSGVTSVAADFVRFLCDEWNKLYDQHLKPFFDSIAEGISSIMGTVLDAWNKYIYPVLQDAVKVLKEVVNNHIKPMVDKIVKFIGIVIDNIKVIWQKWIVPFIQWFIKNVAPVISAALKVVIEVFGQVASVVADVVGGIFQVLGGLINFIVAVFTGDWKKAWNGVKDIFGGIWNMFAGIVKGAFNLVIKAINWVIGKINDALTFTAPDWGFLPDSRILLSLKLFNCWETLTHNGEGNQQRSLSYYDKNVQRLVERRTLKRVEMGAIFN